LVLVGVLHRCAFLVTGVDSTNVSLPVRSGGRFTPISLCPHTPVKVALTDVCGASAAGSVRAGFRRCNGWLHTSWKRRVPGRDGGVPGRRAPGYHQAVGGALTDCQSTWADPYNPRPGALRSIVVR